MERKNSLAHWEQRYEEERAWGLLTSIDLHACNPDTIRNAEKIKEYVDRLCQKIAMKKFGETTVVHFGEAEEVAGYSMMQLIETSLISGHFANKTRRVFIDVFSCKCYVPYEVAEFTKAFFEAHDYTLRIAFRK